MSSSNTTNTPGAKNKSAAQPVDYTQSPDYLKALESFNTQDFDNAYEHLRKELGAHPDNPYAHALMGKIAREKGNPDIFAQAFKAAIKLFEEQKNECEEYYDVATDLLDYAIFMPHSDESARDTHWPKNSQIKGLRHKIIPWQAIYLTGADTIRKPWSTTTKR